MNTSVFGVQRSMKGSATVIAVCNVIHVKPKGALEWAFTVTMVSYFAPCCITRSKV